MKKFLALVFFVGSFCLALQAQIGPPGLSIGTDEVLFEKGVLDVDLVAEIIAEKQAELKQELAKRAILNLNLSEGPYLTYDYANNVITALLEHKDKNVIKKQILESSTETAIVVALTEAYMQIHKTKLLGLELAYLEMMGDSTETNWKVNRFNNKFIKMTTLERPRYIGKQAMRDRYDSIYVQNFDTSQFIRPLPHEVTEEIRKEPVTSPFSTREERDEWYKDSKILTVKKRKKGSSGLGALPKVFHVYKLKDLGVYRGYNFYTYLNYLLLDKTLEVCRKNDALQRLGFFQKNFDETAFRERSHYYRFKREYQEIDLELDEEEAAIQKLEKKLRTRLNGDQLNSSGEQAQIALDSRSISKRKTKLQEAKDHHEKVRIFLEKLDAIAVSLDNTIDKNLEFADVILNRPKVSFQDEMIEIVEYRDNLKRFSQFLNYHKFKPGGDSTFWSNSVRNKEALSHLIKDLSQNIFQDVLKLDLKYVELTEKDDLILQELGELVHYSINFQSTEAYTDYERWAQAINKIIPRLISINSKSKNQLSAAIQDLERLKMAINRIQYAQALIEIFTNERLFKDVSGDDLKDYMAEVFKVLTSLDQASSYDQVAKWIVDVGNIFWDLSKSRLMNNLSNLQAYLTMDEESNRVDIKVDDFILYLGNQYINDISPRLSLYFTVGVNNTLAFNVPDTAKNFNFASEKIGLKFKLYDFVQRNSYTSRHYIARQKPFVKDIYVLGYGSGLLYQIESLKTENALNGSTVGLIFGVHFFNDLDFGIGPSMVRILDDNKFALSASFDIPIVEYLSRLGKKKNKTQGQSD